MKCALSIITIEHSPSVTEDFLEDQKLVKLPEPRDSTCALNWEEFLLLFMIKRLQIF